MSCIFVSDLEKLLGQHRIMGQGDSASVLTRAKVWKMREYWMYFPFFILHDWGKRSAEARSPHLSGVALAIGAAGKGIEYVPEGRDCFPAIVPESVIPIPCDRKPVRKTGVPVRIRQAQGLAPVFPERTERGNLLRLTKQTSGAMMAAVSSR